MAKLLSDNGNITWVHDGQVKTAGNDHFAYSELLQAFKDDDFSAFCEAMDYDESMKKFVSNNYNSMEVVYEVESGKFFFGGQELNTSLTRRILDLKKDGHDIGYMLNFLDNLMENPTPESVDQLYKFLNYLGLPITEDGCFLGYKYLTKWEGEPFTDKLGREVKAGDFVDAHSHSYRNNIGDVNEMPRHMVDHDRNVACSAGFHVGTLEYVRPESGQKHVVIVKVNPKDAVSVPKDHQDQKLRCCKYEVVQLYSEPLYESLYQEDGSNWEVEVEDESWDDVGDLCKGDECYFDEYKHGMTSRRHVFVIEDHPKIEGKIICSLGVNDPNYSFGVIETFSLYDMECIEIV